MKSLPKDRIFRLIPIQRTKLEICINVRVVFITIGKIHSRATEIRIPFLELDYRGLCGLAGFRMGYVKQRIPARKILLSNLRFSLVEGGCSRKA